MFLLLLALSALALGALIGLVLFHLVEPPSERRRLRLLAAQLVAEQRIDSVTRATLQAMRDAARGR